jgi:hypothetical protein
MWNIVKCMNPGICEVLETREIIWIKLLGSQKRTLVYKERSLWPYSSCIKGVSKWDVFCLFQAQFFQNLPVTTLT